MSVYVNPTIPLDRWYGGAEDHEAASTLPCAPGNWGEGDPVGEWDGQRLAQVASNLIGNALQHGEATRPIEIRVDGTSPDIVTLSVTNGGCIAPELPPASVRSISRRRSSLRSR
jgi:signal transduction histidine kinase